MKLNKVKHLREIAAFLQNRNNYGQFGYEIFI